MIGLAVLLIIFGIAFLFIITPMTWGLDRKVFGGAGIVCFVISGCIFWLGN